MSDGKFTFNVDVVGTCNLRCPTCPIGNISHKSLPSNAMPPEKLKEIVRKAKKETRKASFHLYNWTEPLIHPRIGDCIEVVRNEGVPVHLSTNLNLPKRIEEVADARPNYIRVSLSGFNQENYGLTHAGGDIEIVKQNMQYLAEAVARNGFHTKLTVLFHRYLGNHADEIRMKDFSEKLGYTFEAVWAYLMPLEKVLAFAEDGPDAAYLNDADRTIIAKLALPLDKAIEVARTKQTKDCILRSDQFAINSNGDVAVCCSVYNENPIGNYLDEPLETLQKRKYASEICRSCMKNGLHVLGTYGAPNEFEKLAKENVKRHYPDAQLSPSFTKLTLRKILQSIRARIEQI